MIKPASGYSTTRFKPAHAPPHAPNTYHAPVTALRPVAAQKLPAVHGVGAAMLAVAHRNPAGHGAGALLAAGQNDPAVHARCVPLDDPAGQ